MEGFLMILMDNLKRKGFLETRRADLPVLASYRIRVPAYSTCCSRPCLATVESWMGHDSDDLAKTRPKRDGRSDKEDTDEPHSSWA